MRYPSRSAATPEALACYQAAQSVPAQKFESGSVPITHLGWPPFVVRAKIISTSGGLAPYSFLACKPIRPMRGRKTWARAGLTFIPGIAGGVWAARGEGACSAPVGGLGMSTDEVWEGKRPSIDGRVTCMLGLPEPGCGGCEIVPTESFDESNEPTLRWREDDGDDCMPVGTGGRGGWPEMCPPFWLFCRDSVRLRLSKLPLRLGSCAPLGVAGVDTTRWPFCVGPTDRPPAMPERLLAD